ncbi:MAG: hypothetical protein IPH06_00055 [Alphaproteobacteria bacterium]|nr:hypothetical protein [Alphaproteobacteria bacterium]
MCSKPTRITGFTNFSQANEGKTVYLDVSIVRYVPMDPSSLDTPEARAATDRFEHPVFSKCWPDQRAEYIGILNFGEAGFPLPLDDADIEAGCATRVRFDLPMIRSVSAFPVAWGDNKAQVFLRGFFDVSKSVLEGSKTLYTLKQQDDVPYETSLAFDKHKTGKQPEAKPQPPDRLNAPVCRSCIQRPFCAAHVSRVCFP